jgi:hypothetical protein
VKIASIILFIALLFSDVFYCISLNVNMIQARLDAIERLSRPVPIEDLTIIKIAAKEVKEIEKTELWYDGKLYDIATTGVLNDTIYYYAMEDHKEEETIGLIYEHFSREFNAANLLPFRHIFHHSTIKGTYQLYCFRLYEYKKHQSFSFIHYINQHTSCTLGIHEVLTPPPKNIPVSGFNA